MTEPEMLATGSMKNSESCSRDVEVLVSDISTILVEARKAAAVQINNELVRAYWNIGRLIVEYEQGGKAEAKYGASLLKETSRRLTKEFGRGFSVSNLQFMRRFYLTHKNQQTLSVKLSWSHYCELLSINDDSKRAFYEKETIGSGWSVRELRRQKESMLFERVLMAKKNADSLDVAELANKGIEIATPQDIIKDPYVLDFVGLPPEKPIYESDLEEALVRRIEEFMLELGKGFMFVGTQQRVTLNNVHHYVDMVFYNKILRSYVLIELKTKSLMPEAVGQINAYLNYYAAEVNDSDDNAPIGIILCTDKDELNAEYALGGMTNAIFASKYTLVMPEEDELVEQVRSVIAQNDRKRLGSPKAENLRITEDEL